MLCWSRISVCPWEKEGRTKQCCQRKGCQSLKNHSPLVPLLEEIETGKRQEKQEKRSVNNYVFTTKYLLTSSRLVNEIQILRESSVAAPSPPHSQTSVELPLPCPLQNFEQDQIEQEQIEQQQMVPDQTQAVTAVNVSRTEAESSDVCTCGIVHTFQSLRDGLTQQPAPSKKDKSSPAGYHSCTKLWLETTFRISNKLFVCLACGRENDEEKGISYWCFKEKPQLYNVKRHYMRRHPEDPITKQMCPQNQRPISYSADQLNKEILTWIIKRNHAFSLVEEAEFRSILYNLNPELHLLHRTQIVAKYLPIIDTELSNKVSDHHLHACTFNLKNVIRYELKSTGIGGMPLPVIAGQPISINQFTGAVLLCIQLMIIGN